MCIRDSNNIDNNIDNNISSEYLIKSLKQFIANNANSDDEKVNYELIL